MFNQILGFKLYLLLYYFIIFSFAGWLMETIRVSFRNKCFVNRGFLNGPFCPIYGVGMNLIILFLSWLKGNYILLAILGMILATVLEYLTSYILEKLFNENWWDYSYRKFNINGRVSLDISIAWGILALIMIEFVVPLFNYFLERINISIGIFFIYIFLIYFFIDLFVTVYHLISFKVILQKFKANKAELFEAIRVLRNSIKNKLDTEELSYKFEEKFDMFVLKYFDRENIKVEIADFKDDFKEFFADLSERFVEEPLEKLNIQNKINEYKNKYFILNKAKTNLIHKRILKAFPNINKKYKIRVSFVQEIKNYFNDKNTKDK